MIDPWWSGFVSGLSLGLSVAAVAYGLMGFMLDKKKDDDDESE